jgi:predicted ferric reductase
MTRARAQTALVFYVALVCFPLAIAAAPPHVPGRPFWTELGIALGFVALGQAVLQFGLIARVRPMSRPFGIDVIMQFHRRMGLLAIGLAAAHAVILVARQPAILGLLDPRRADGSTCAAGLSILLLILLTAVSIFRQRLGIGYELWRASHLLFSIAALVAAHVHVALGGGYVTRGWKSVAIVAYSASGIAFVGYLRLVLPFFLRRRPWVLESVRPERASTWIVALAAVGHPGMRFAPGQFVWLRIDRSAWSLREHPFSIASSASTPGRIELTIKERGDFTRTIGSLPVGARAYLEGPHGSFSSDFVARGDLLFIAGGIGIAPILSILRTLRDRNDEGRHVLVYATSSWDRTAFREELASLSTLLALAVVHVLEHPHDGWDGERGQVTEELLARVIRAHPSSKEAFICGPDAMMEAADRGLRACGLPRGRIHMERFQLV